MLGNLFDEENDSFPDLASAFGSDSSASGKSTAPPPPRPNSKLAGIANQGATCYLNSLLQTLLFTPEFRDALFCLSERELGCLEDAAKPGAKVRVIPLQLQRLFVRLLLLNQPSVSTEELTQSFGWNNNEQLQQHDVQELNRILFSAIEASLAGTSGSNLIQQLYHGNIVNQIICQKCGKVSEREEDFLDLTLSVSGIDSLETGLVNSYCDMETMDGKNQYKCERCQMLVDAKKGAKIRKLPPILTISLLRFSFDFKKMERYKETGKFSFPADLDMAPLVEQTSSHGDLMYELFSVVIHRGGAYGGHYHAYIRDLDDLGTWSSPGKVDVEIPSDPKTGAVEMIKTNSPQEVIEVILQKIPDKSMIVDKLGSEIFKQTGVTWNKRFKKSHGSIVKFLSQCEGKIMYNPHTRWVHLLEGEGTPAFTCSESTATKKEESSQNGPEDDSSNKHPGKKERPPSPEPLPGNRWFNFDDSRVSPIHQSRIEKHFQGRESAYMLFYRQKTSDRPEARGNPSYLVPDLLLADVLTENDTLDKAREEYDEKVNKITVQLHWVSSYQYKEGALKPVSGSEKFMELTIDRRKTVSDLIVAVKEAGGSLAPETFVIHRMRDLPAGYHLYDCVSDDPTQHIMSLNIDNNTKLFVWDGKQVDGSSFPVGVECEPVYLTIVYGNPSQFSSGYPKNITFADLKSSVCDLTGIPIGDLSLKKLVQSESSPFCMLNEDDETLPIAVLNFKDGDQIVAENKKIMNEISVQEVSKKEQSFTIVIENRCRESENRLTKNIEVTQDMVIGDLKLLAAMMFDEDSIEEGGRLRLDHPSFGLRAPLHEQKTVGDTDLTKGSYLILEPGKAPETNEITLTFAPHDPSNDRPDLEVTVDKDICVAELLRIMLKESGSTGSQWHLRKTNWCGEPGEVLDDLDLSLGKSLLKNGDHLLLLPGSLPPKGYLRLPIYLYPTPDNPRHTGPEQQGMIAWISAGIKGLLSSSSSSSSLPLTEFEPVQVGEIDISKDATLEDLKLQIMTLPAMTDLPIPTHEFLRVRLISEHRPATVLKDLQQTLRRQKVTGASRIAVQILPQEEKLTVQHLVVNVMERIPGTQDYCPPQEFIWNTSRSTSANSFRQCIAYMLVLPVEQITVAKHFHRQFKWLVIEDKTNPPSHQKGKKKKGSKSCIKNAPFHLQDGDDIGVKTVQGDPINVDDFSTEEDVIGREEVERQADEKRKMREERKRDYGEGKTKRRPEVALTIKVDSFT